MSYRKFLTAGFVAIGGFALAAQGEITLQRTLLENSTDTYKIISKVDQTIKSPQLGEQPMNVTSDMTYKLQTNKVDTSKGSADVQATTSVDTVDFGDSPLAALVSGKKPSPVVQDGTIDKYGHLVFKSMTGGDPTVSTLMGLSGNMQAALFVELPDHPVKVGDSWDVIIPKGPFTGDSDQKLTAKLTGDQKVDGKDAWTVDLSGTINVTFDSASPSATANPTNPFAKHHVIVKGATTIQGTGTVEKATGKTLSLVSTGTMQSTVELPDDGDITAQTSGTIATNVKLQS